MDLTLPPEHAADIEPLLPRLERLGVASLSVSSYSRPGEPKFWLAYLYVGGRRFVCATPELSNQTLDVQWPALLTELKAFDPANRRPAFDE